MLEIQFSLVVVEQAVELVVERHLGYDLFLVVCQLVYEPWMHLNQISLDSLLKILSMELQMLILDKI